MEHSYTAAQIRAAEAIALAQVGDPALMARAARAVADAVTARMPSPVLGRRAVLLVGAGNNGGDALHAGAILRRRGMAVTAVLAVLDRAHPGGLAALRRAGGRVVTAADERVPGLLSGADAVLDGLVGLGARPPLRPPMDRLVTLAAAGRGWQVAVDLPSGVDPDTGATAGPAFRADVTVTVGGVKTGLLLADDLAGEVLLARIGMDPAQLMAGLGAGRGTGRVAEQGVGQGFERGSEQGVEQGLERRIRQGHDAIVVTDADVSRLLPHPGAGDDKYSGGVVGIVAGSPRYPGAALLCVGGAVRLRPGLVRYAGTQAAAVLQAWPEVVATGDVAETGQVQAWVAGPGMGTDGAALRLLRDVLDADVPVLVDADGLTLLAQVPALLADRRRRGAVTVLTPHTGEFARLFGDLDPADRVTSVRAAASRSGAVVLLKGHRTVIADPAGRLAINTSGSSWLATAGSGDVLSGVAGSVLATGLDPLLAMALAAHLHGRAGERAAAAGRAGASALADFLR